MPIVNIGLWAGRDKETKKKLIENVTKTVCETVKCPPEAVIVVIQRYPQGKLGAKRRAGSLMAEEKRELFNKINNDLKNAMKARDELRLSVLRMMKSKVLYVNARGDLPDTEIIKILTKYGKDIKESIEEFKKVGRLVEVERSEKELKIVQEYLPKELSPDEIKSLVQQAVAETGATSIKEMGNVMKAVLAKSPGIDGKLVNQFVREILK